MENIGILSIFFIWLVGTVMNGFIAQEKGRTASKAVIVSIIASPMLAYLYLLAVPSKVPAPPKQVEG